MPEAVSNHIHNNSAEIEEFVGKATSDPDLPVDSSEGYEIQKVSSAHVGTHFNNISTPSTVEVVDYDSNRMMPQRKFRRGMPIDAIIRECVNKRMRSRKQRDQRKATRRAQRKK